MNENKRFKLYIKWYNKEKTEGEFILTDGGQPLGVIDSIEDARLIRDTLNELNDFKDNILEVIDKKIEWHLLQAKKCRNQGNIKKAIKFEEAIMTLNILKRDIEK